MTPRKCKYCPNTAEEGETMCRACWLELCKRLEMALLTEHENFTGRVVEDDG
jgi:hypothetical protein